MGDDGDDDDTLKYKLFPKGSDQPRENGSKWYTGEGKASYVNKDEYDGTYVEGNRSGTGVYTFFKNGDIYDGHYELNKKNGFGKMTYKNQNKGDDEEEAEEGEGAKPRGGCYLGNFTAGKRQGTGTFTYENGDVYVGEWHSGKKHGQGTYTYGKDDTKLVGKWEDGKISSGKWVFPNGTFYVGKFQYNKPFGKGVWVFKDGNQLTGEYRHKPKPSDNDDADDAEDGQVKPDPQVWCRFQHDKSVTVQGGSAFIPSQD